jgi:tRNA dimethylallyltransferase
MSPATSGAVPVALVGVTASGKSAVALEVARRAGDVEILSIDSMCVYRHMDIATDKPSPEARAAVPHHLLDLVEPDQEFTVYEFQQAARAALRDIAGRGRRALLVGGTGLHLRSVVDDLELPGRWPEVAAELEAEADRPGGTAALHARLAALDPLAASRTTDANRRRIVRALEVTIGSGRPFSSFGPGLTAYPPTRFRLVGLPFDPAVADPRIEERFRAFMDRGLLAEVRALAARPGGLSRTARQALGYREVLAHVEEGVPLDVAVAEAIRRTRAFARRQWSWFRRDPRIDWVGPGDDPVEVVTAALGDRWEEPDRSPASPAAPAGEARSRVGAGSRAGARDWDRGGD